MEPVMKDSEHARYYNSKGEEVPSVTTILKLYPKNLTRWANMLGFKHINVKQFVDDKAALGTEIHAVVEYYFKSGNFPNQRDYNKYISLNDFVELQNRILFIEQKLAGMGYKIFKVEYQMHGEQFGGTIDLLFYNEEKDTYALFDIKTAKSVYGSMRCQLAAYIKLLKETDNIDVSYCGIILIMKNPEDDGFFNIWSKEDVENDWVIFTNILNIYYIMDDNELSFILN